MLDIVATNENTMFRLERDGKIVGVLYVSIISGVWYLKVGNDNIKFPSYDEAIEFADELL